MHILDVFCLDISRASSDVTMQNPAWSRRQRRFELYTNIIRRRECGVDPPGPDRDAKKKIFRPAGSQRGGCCGDVLAKILYYVLCINSTYYLTCNNTSTNPTPFALETT